MTDDQREAYEERAAILEFEAGMTRADAEKAAMAMVCAPVTSSRRGGN